MGRLEQKVALVTGAGSGIGRSIALRFAEEGAYVAVCTRTRDHGEAVLREIQASGGSGTFVQTDVRYPDELRAMVDGVVAEAGRIDILVNNVGVTKGATGPFWTIDETAWDDVFSLNVKAMFLAAKYCFEHMPKGSSIINIGSVASLRAYPGEAAYIATKGAVLQLSRAMACDLGAHDIRVNCLCPGMTDTPSIRTWVDGSADPAALERQFGAKSLLNRMARPDEIAGAATFLASDDASFVTGAALAVDGGWTAGGLGTLLLDD